MSTIGVVIIGRNEGPRLGACMQSVRKAERFQIVDVVYVDSNSTDNSVQIAMAHGAHVVHLNPAVRFTAARARNAGAEALFARNTDITYIQFLDGDTELNITWLVHAAAYLDRHPAIAVVAGRVRERRPEASIYNLLGDMEWDTPIGESHEFGGIAMIRAAAFRKAGGYTADFIAGEEPELACRLRLAGHRIMRLNHEMVLHDLAMTHFSQWWKRSVRSGHSIAQLYHTHGGPPLFFYKAQWRSTLFWTMAVPAFILFLSCAITAWAMLLLPLAYLYLGARILRYRLRHGDDRNSALVYASFTTIGKFPQLLGMLRFYRNLWAKRPSTIIEYKAVPAVNSPNPTPASVGNT